MTDENPYRTPGTSGGAACTPVVIDPPLGLDAFWIVTDGTIWLTARGDITLESEMCGRFTTPVQALGMLQRAGERARARLHLLRVDLTATVTDETFLQSLSATAGGR